MQIMELFFYFLYSFPSVTLLFCILGKFSSTQQSQSTFVKKKEAELSHSQCKECCVKRNAADCVGPDKISNTIFGSAPISWGISAVMLGSCHWVTILIGGMERITEERDSIDNIPEI